MGRHQIIGNEFCPIPKCPSLSLVRFFTKKVRNRSTGNYAKRFYCQHNDKKIKEHYVDNYVRKRQTELLQTHPLGEIIKLANLRANEYDKIAFLIHKVAKQLKDLPLTDNERLELSNYFEQKTEIITALTKIMKLLNLGIMLRLKGKEIPDWLQVEEKKLIDLSKKFNERLETKNNLIMQNPLKAMRKATKIIKSDPLYSAYEKYEFPKRLQRYKNAGKMDSNYPIK
jgi:hypothetical protein